MYNVFYVDQQGKADYIVVYTWAEAMRKAKEFEKKIGYRNVTIGKR